MWKKVTAVAVISLVIVAVQSLLPFGVSCGFTDIESVRGDCITAGADVATTTHADGSKTREYSNCETEIRIEHHGKIYFVTSDEPWLFSERVRTTTVFLSRFYVQAFGQRHLIGQPIVQAVGKEHWIRK